MCQLTAPFAPFIADEIYTKLTGEESVHISFFPKGNRDLLDKNVEERMDLVRSLVSLGRGIREKERIKVRQPLPNILVDGEYESLISDLNPLLMEELNVKEVSFEKDLDAFMNFSLKPEFKVAGPTLGPKIKAFAAYLNQLEPKFFVKALDSNDTLSITLEGQDFTIDKSFVDVRIEAKEGFAVAMENGVFAILDTTLTPDLIQEGLARELISKVQQMRKQKDFEMMDRIKIYVSADEDVQEAIGTHKDYIMKETLALEIIDTNDSLEISDLNGHKTGISVEKI